MTVDRQDLAPEDFAREFVRKMKEEGEGVEAVAMLVELLRAIEELMEPAFAGRAPFGAAGNEDEVAVFGHRSAVRVSGTRGFSQDIDGDVDIRGTSIRIDADTGAVNIYADDVYVRNAAGDTMARILDGTDVTVTTDDLIFKDTSGQNIARIRERDDCEIWTDDFSILDAGGTENVAVRDVAGTVRVYLLTLQAQSSNPANLEAVVRNSGSGELRRWTGTAQTW